MKAILSILAAGVLFTSLAAFGQNGTQPTQGQCQGQCQCQERGQCQGQCQGRGRGGAPGATPMEMAFANGPVSQSARGAVR
jgi:hypothetical protein